MTINQYDKLITLLIESRGERGCDDALRKLRKNYGVKRTMEIPNYHASSIINKVQSELTNKDIQDTFPDGIMECECGGSAIKKGRFLFCKKCNKLLDEINTPSL